MSGPRRPAPGEQPDAEHDPAMDELLEYLAATALAPAPDLASRIQVRIAQEPDRTPARRFLLALVHLRLFTALGAFRQLVRVAAGGGNFPTLLRAQALGLVLVTTLSFAALGVGAAASVQRVITDRRGPAPTQPVPTVTSPTDGPTLVPTASTPPTTDDSPMPSTDPSPTPSATPEPAAQGDRPGKTQRPASGSGTTAHPTPRPESTRTPRPGRTPRPEPTRTPRPGRTPHPTERPERTERPEPTETPEPEDGDGHGGGSGASETDKPDDGSVRSGVVMAAGPVPPSWAIRPEGPA